jgi:hypothetical protein
MCAVLHQYRPVATNEGGVGSRKPHEKRVFRKTKCVIKCVMLNDMGASMSCKGLCYNHLRKTHPTTICRIYQSSL